MKKALIFCLLIIGLVLEFMPYIIEAQAQDKPWWPREFWATYPFGERRRVVLNPPKANKKYTIGVTYPHFKSPYWVGVAYGNALEAKVVGVKVLIKAATGYEDLTGQIAQVENFIQQNVNAIILGPISFEGNTASALEAQKKGIPVICSGQTINTHDYAALSSMDLYNLGVTKGEWIAKKSGGKANVAIIPGPSGASWTQMGYEGIQYAFRNYPGIKVLATKWCDIDVPVAQNITENLLQTFPNLDYIITADILAEGVCNAVEAAKRKTKVVSDFAVESLLPYVKRGTVAMCIAGAPVLDGRIALDLAVRVLNGEKNRPWVVNQDPVIITPENVDKLDRSILWAPKDWKIPAVVE